MRILASAFLVLVLGTNAFGQCHAPHYRKGRDFVNSKSGRGSLDISVRPSDFTVDKLVCLAQTLKTRHPGWKEIIVQIFSSHDAAMLFSPVPLEVQREWWVLWARQLHATYVLNAEKHEEYLEIMPLGFDEESSSTRVDLPLVTTPRCRQGIENRCLMAVLGEITYPDEALKAKVSGTVTVTGTIARDGTMTSIQVADANVMPLERKDLLVHEVLENLKTWRFDESQSQDAFRISFSYAIDTSLPHRDQIFVKLALPNQVTITGNPPE